jgi:hypothetical protein
MNAVTRPNHPTAGMWTGTVDGRGTMIGGLTNWALARGTGSVSKIAVKISLRRMAAPFFANYSPSRIA